MSRSQRRKWASRVAVCALCLSIVLWLASITFVICYYRDEFGGSVGAGSIQIYWGYYSVRGAQFMPQMFRPSRESPPLQDLRTLYESNGWKPKVWFLAIRPRILLSRAFWRSDWLGFCLPAYKSRNNGPYPGQPASTAHWLTVPVLWIVLAAAIACFQIAHSRRRFRGTICQECAYELRGNVSGVCPECGTRIPGFIRASLGAEAGSRVTPGPFSPRQCRSATAYDPATSGQACGSQDRL